MPGPIAGRITPPARGAKLGSDRTRSLHKDVYGNADLSRVPAFRSEPFMNEKQREYFRRKLNGMKEEILRESRETIQNLQAETVPHADLADRASTEAERQLELRTRDRQRKLIAKIDAALRRIDDGSYGFCERDRRPHQPQAPRRPPDRDPVH